MQNLPLAEPSREYKGRGGQGGSGIELLHLPGEAFINSVQLSTHNSILVSSLIRVVYFTNVQLEYSLF